VNYSVGDIVLACDDATPQGEMLTILSIAGTTLTCTTNLVSSYTMVRNAKVQNQSHFTPRTTPTKAFMDTIIEMNEGVLDRDIHSSYRQNGVFHSEWLTRLISGAMNYPYFSMPLRYPFDTAYPVEFSYRGVCPFDRSKGDMLEFIWGSEWRDALDPLNGYRIWESVIDTIVNANTAAGAAPITATLAMQPRLITPVKWRITHTNITAFNIELIGIDETGTVRTENFTQALGWSGYSTYDYASITSIKITSRTGTGTGDTLTVTTQKDESRMSSDYDAWMDYEHGIFYAKSMIIQDGMKTLKATYRHSNYYTANKVIPNDIKKAMIFLCGIDLLSNERYGVNLPGGAVGDRVKLETQINTWNAQYKVTIAKRRISPGIGKYQ
jgi:hypothetical protein